MVAPYTTALSPMGEHPDQDLFGIYDGLLDPSFCEEVIARFERDERKVQGLHGYGDQGGRHDPSVKSTTEILLWQHSRGWEDVMQTLNASLKEGLQRYMSCWGEAFPCALRQEEPRITRYLPGEGFTWHSDNIGLSPTRVITAIWYLNDVAEGGETEYCWQGRSVAPVQGRLLLCPVGWWFRHRGVPPVSGPKYIAITQLHQVQPKAQQGSKHQAA